MTTIAIFNIVALLMVYSVSVLAHHQTVRCPPPRLVNIHIDDMLGYWKQYVFEIVNNAAVLFSCETFNVTLQNGSYIGVIQVPGLEDLTFNITELPGPVFYQVGTPNPTLQFIDQITTYTRGGGVKVSLSHVFRSGNNTGTYVVLASKTGYIDTAFHESLLESVGIHRNLNSTVIPASRCPLLAFSVN